MKPNRTTTGLLLLVVMAAVGFLLVYMPGKLVEQYQLVREAGPVWITVYFSVVGAGAVILLGLTLWILGRLWLRPRAESRPPREAGQESPRTNARGEPRTGDRGEACSWVTDFQDESPGAAEVRRQLEPVVRELQRKRQAQTLEIVAFGTISSGKSSLLNAGRSRRVPDRCSRWHNLPPKRIPWPGIDTSVVDTPGLGEVHGAERADVSAEAAGDAESCCWWSTGRCATRNSSWSAGWVGWRNACCCA